MPRLVTVGFLGVLGLAGAMSSFADDPKGFTVEESGVVESKKDYQTQKDYEAGVSKKENRTGTLTVDVKAFTTDLKLKKNILKQLRGSGLEWGIVGDEVVISLVSRKFIKPSLGQLTRFGERETIELESGVYSLTCVGYIHRSNSRDVEKVLDASAFFNLKVASFNIDSDINTLVEVLPTYQKHTKIGFWKSTAIFLPDLLVNIFEEEKLVYTGEISSETQESIPWSAYFGPLKN